MSSLSTTPGSSRASSESNSSNAHPTALYLILLDNVCTGVYAGEARTPSPTPPRPGLHPRYQFHFDDYSVPELVTIMNIKLVAKGYKLTADASSCIGDIIQKNTTAALRSKYNGRLTDNLIQWASDEMNTRLPLDASGEQLVTLQKSDFDAAIKRFSSARPPTKADPTLLGSKEVETQLNMWGLQEYSQLFVRAGYRQLYDLLALQTEKDVRALGVTKDADVRRAVQLVKRLEQEHRKASREMDARFLTPDMESMKTWLDARNLGEHSKAFDKHKIDFEVLGDLSYDDLKEMGVSEVGKRRQLHRAITQWRDERDRDKDEALREKMAMIDHNSRGPRMADVADRIMQLKHGLNESGKY